MPCAGLAGIAPGARGMKESEVMKLKAEIKNGKLLIEIDADITNPRPSKSGKTRIVSSTNGNVQTSAMVNGKPVTVGLNAYIKA